MWTLVLFTFNFCKEIGAFSPCQLGHMHTTLHGRIKAVWLAQEHHAALLKALGQRKKGVWCYHTLSQGTVQHRNATCWKKAVERKDVPVLPFYKRGSPRPARNIHLLDHRTRGHRTQNGLGWKGPLKVMQFKAPAMSMDINASISTLQQGCWQARNSQQKVQNPAPHKPNRNMAPGSGILAHLEQEEQKT